jgi:hypothetical protein
VRDFLAGALMVVLEVGCFVSCCDIKLQGLQKVQTLEAMGFQPKKNWRGCDSSLRLCEKHGLPISVKRCALYHCLSRKRIKERTRQRAYDTDDAASFKLPHDLDTSLFQRKKKRPRFTFGVRLLSFLKLFVGIEFFHVLLTEAP